MPDLSKPDHLPNLRPGGEPPRPSWLPKQRRGITPQMIGRYPDYNVLDAVKTWDEATKKVVLARLEPPGPLRYFTKNEEPTFRAFCDTVMAQDREPKVPVAEAVDTKLADRQLDGYQYADMPEDGETWRQVIRGLDDTASARFGRNSFAEGNVREQEAIIEDFSQGDLPDGEWKKLNVSRAWTICMGAVLSAFYSHPWAWNEIGFGGPAYPRGFMRMGPVSTLEPFERPGATTEDPVRTTEEGQF